MTRDEVLGELRGLLDRGEVTKEEVGALLSSTHVEGVRKWHLPKISEILAYIGGLIVILGIAILIGQNWKQLGDFTKITTTLGSGIAAYLVGIIFSKQEGRVGNVGMAFHVIAATVIPMGLFVTFEILGFRIETNQTQTLISILLFASYLSSFFLFRKNLFLLISLAFGSWFFFAITNWIVEGSSLLRSNTFLEYRFLLVGITYMLLGYRFSNSREKPLMGVLYSLGIVGFLGAAFSLSFNSTTNIFWQLLFPILTFGSIFMSVYLRHRSFLTFGALFLTGYIIKVTSDYFSGSLGWPLALVISGFAIIGIGYATFYINNKYIKREEIS